MRCSYAKTCGNQTDGAAFVAVFALGSPAVFELCPACARAEADDGNRQFGRPWTATSPIPRVRRPLVQVTPTVRRRPPLNRRNP